MSISAYVQDPSEKAAAGATSEARLLSGLADARLAAASLPAAVEAQTANGNRLARAQAARSLGASQSAGIAQGGARAAAGRGAALEAGLAQSQWGMQQATALADARLRAAQVQSETAESEMGLARAGLMESAELAIQFKQMRDSFGGTNRNYRDWLEMAYQQAPNQAIRDQILQEYIRAHGDPSTLGAYSGPKQIEAPAVVSPGTIGAGGY